MDVKLATLVDIDQHLFIERGMRGGISMITHRHAKANNPLMADYNLAEPNSYILYLDANNLYGWAMSQPLPVGEFKWMAEEQLNQFDITQDLDDAPVGTVEKLVPNLQTKQHYVLHYRNLKLYLELGMELTKIHRVLQFR